MTIPCHPTMGGRLRLLPRIQELISLASCVCPHPRTALRGQVPLLGCFGIGLFHRALVVEPFSGGRPPMPGIEVEDFARRLGHDLSLEGLALLLTRVDTLLPGRQAGATHRRCEAVTQYPLPGVGGPPEL